MHQQEQGGSVVSLLCDGGERYQHTYYNDHWLADQGFDLSAYCNRLDFFYHSGEFSRRFLARLYARYRVNELLPINLIII